MRISDWSSDVCSSDLDANPLVSPDGGKIAYLGFDDKLRAYENNQLYVMNRDGSGKRSLTADWDYGIDAIEWAADGRSVYAQYDDHGETKVARIGLDRGRSEEHTSEIQSLMRDPYALFCLK